MRRKRAKPSARDLTKEVQFFSICTNDSFPDTLYLDRTYETVAGFSCIPLPPPLIGERQERTTSRRQSHYVRRDTMGGERSYTMLRLSLVMRELSLPSQRLTGKSLSDEWHSARKSPSLGSEARSSQDGSKRSETTSSLPCARWSPSDTAGSSAFKRRSPQPRFLRHRPRLTRSTPSAERPLREQDRSDTSSPPPRIARQSSDRQT